MLTKQEMDMHYKLLKHFQTEVRCITEKLKTCSVQNKPGRGREWKISKTLEERKLVINVSKALRTELGIVASNQISPCGTIEGLFYSSLKENYH